MKKTFSAFAFLTILIFSVLTINSCGSNNDTVSCFPSSPINVSLNLNLTAYNNLNYSGNWIYVDQEQSGTRGLIVVRTQLDPAKFGVFDRNAPHLCPDTNTTLKVKDNISIICPKDNMKWMLNGTPESGGSTSLPPKTYPYNYDASTKTLSIYY